MKTNSQKYAGIFKKKDRQKEEDQLLFTDLMSMTFIGIPILRSVSVRHPININMVNYLSLHKWTHAVFGKRLRLGSNACHSEIQRTGCHAHFP